MSNKTKKLFIECKECCLNCSITYQRINEYSVEIYRKYDPKKEPPLFYTDGHLTMKQAVKSARKWLRQWVAKHDL